MKIRALGLALVTAALALACTKTKPPACGDASALPCVTERVCEYDKSRGCTVCRCAAPPYVRPATTGPQGPADPPR